MFARERAKSVKGTRWLLARLFAFRIMGPGVMDLKELERRLTELERRQRAFHLAYFRYAMGVGALVEKEYDLKPRAARKIRDIDDEPARRPSPKAE